MARERAPLIGFIGAEGSGKTSQAEMLAESFGLPCVATGKMIRYAQKHDTSWIGDKCREMERTKSYLDAETLLLMLAAELKNNPKGVVLDGGFRTVKETQDFEEMLKANGLDFGIRIIYLNVPGELGVRRILDGPDRGRSDDNEEDIRKRQGRFYHQLDERLALIKSKWELIEIDARPNRQKVHEEIVLLLLANQSSGNLSVVPSLQPA